LLNCGDRGISTPEKRDPKTQKELVQSRKYVTNYYKGFDPMKRKPKVLVTGAHPGDPEYGCGGTIARYTSLGHEVVLLYLNRGEGGIAQLSGEEAGAIRTGEAQAACNILNARPIFAGQVDGKSEINAVRYDQYRKIIQREKPDIVFTHWPIDNHADHRANFVDISDIETKKRAACFAHASQAPEMFYALQEQVCRFRGIENGCRYAEAFIRIKQEAMLLIE
jgi:N-acetylglucosamine malate deacetylase 1